VRNETKDMYLAFKHVEKHMRPTPVHLQVFVGISTHTVRRCEPDHFSSLDVAHVLPVLLLFTMPGKYCIRAGAFKHVTDVQLAPLSLMHPNFSFSPTSLIPQNWMLQAPSGCAGHSHYGFSVLRVASNDAACFGHDRRRRGPANQP
jgi:hypothetical protein